MELSLIGANVVVLAKNHNPAIPTKDWLLRKKIFLSQPIQFVNTPVFSLWEDAEYTLQIDESRLLLSLKRPTSVLLPELAKHLVLYVRSLPETPYVSMGVNLVWDFRPSEVNEIPVRILTDRFCKEHKRIQESLRVADFKFGLTLLYATNETRVTCVFKPVVDSNDFKADFNFHTDLSGYEGQEKITALCEAAESIGELCVQGKETLDNLFKES